MRLNSKVTWGLAWAGLAVVLAVPSADYLTGQFGTKNSAALITSTTDPLKTGTVKAPAVQKTSAVTTKITKNGVSIIPNGAAAPKSTTDVAAASPVLGPVDKLLKTGKPLPDYISDDDKLPAPVVKAPADDSTQVATIDPAPPVVAPIPFPARPPDVVRPALPRTTQPPVVVDETALATQDDSPPDQLADAPDGPVPPTGIQDDWRSVRERKLAKFLERNGLLDDGSADGRSSASVIVVQKPSPDYDPNGFYLSDGPNSSRAARRARVQQLFGDDQGDDSGFTQF